MKRVTVIVCLVSCLFLASCFKSSCFSSCPEGVQHVVLVWLKDHGNKAHRNEIIKAAGKLTKINSVKQLQIGTVLPSERKIVDSSFDLGISMVFDDQESLNSYITHPIHQRLVEEVLKPYSARYVVYDFVLSDVSR